MEAGTKYEPNHLMIQSSVKTSESASMMGIERRMKRRKPA